MELEAWVWYEECGFEDAKSETLGAADIYERLGATKDLERCRALLRNIEGEINEQATSARGTGRHLTSLSRRVLPQTTGHASGQIFHSQM
ncbi:hypothetical protein BDM02DRAFT_3272667 [Thelephora ganbajun]|uniref:Uncharacterized protein n=1 Tax=Thelephora ganbajun TaxID=370292 RepID=A0ACB6Z2X0_THEGA|nr:hypothetical protein BDM02DRAFT_3272667 [Thelephora ganbajun]